jgi:hypothetical protein
MNIFDGWLSLEQLKAATQIAGTNGHRPHPHQGIAQVPGVLRSLLRQTAATDGSSRAQRCVILAVDGIHYDVAQAHWSADVLLPMTSTFPSTSVVAWLTASTGLPPECHGVPGVVFYDRDSNVLINCITDSIVTAPGQSLASRSKEPIPRNRTIFQDLRDMGVDCYAVLGDLANFPGRWRDAVLLGCRNVEIASLGRAEASSSIVERVIQQTQEVIAHQTRNESYCIWSFVNFDDYAHLHGYDDRVRNGLATLNETAHAWAASGHTVVAYSDHGMTRSTSIRNQFAAWGDLVTSCCDLPVGGAGRVRWFYPRPGEQGNFVKAARALAKHSALILSPADLENMGLFSKTPVGIGCVVLVANGLDFPFCEADLPFDHGSFTYDEMFVPLAIWVAR